MGRAMTLLGRRILSASKKARMTHYRHELLIHRRSRSNRYDHLDRRVQKITPEATHTYFYDGWMLIKEIVANTNGTTDVIEYHWGKDLSGTIGGAGGVGGLLYLTISNSSTRQLYVPWYDAYGNVMGYWDAQGNVVAEYTYDAFGKMLSSGGPMADVFAIRYSTHVRRRGFPKTSSTDKYPDMFNALYARLKRYLTEKRKCTTNITIYEGERVRGGPATEKTFKKWKKGDWHE